jgi:hypothetical protein
VDLVAGSISVGHAAIAALVHYGVDVLGVALHWGVVQGLVTERVWRVTLRRAYPDRAEEMPLFVSGYRLYPCDAGMHS